MPLHSRRTLGRSSRRSTNREVSARHHILLWWIAQDKRLTRKQRTVLKNAAKHQPLLVSDISLWEVATLHSLGRIHLRGTLRDWLEQATAPPLVRRVGITPAVAAEVAELPDSFHRDPADRILVATAKVFRATLLTRDQRILDAQLTDCV